MESVEKYQKQLLEQTQYIYYDRVIFTAGAYDLPHHFFEQMKEGGLLLIVIKSEGGGDTLFLLRKMHECFESLESTPCGFVEMKGKYQLKNLKPVRIESLPEWPELKRKLIGTRPFWWGGKGKEEFQWKTAGIRSFPGIIGPSSLPSKLKDATSDHAKSIILGFGIKNKSLWLSQKMVCFFPMEVRPLKNVC